ncbi:MAG: hypothetical protein ACYDCJ_12510 [Gammaproteobacteria bacterium]
MAFATPLVPNLTDFTDFLTTSVQIPTAALPVDSVWIGYAFNQAMDYCPALGGGVLYTLAVYHCGAHLLFAITPDQAGQTYFADARSAAPSTNFPSGGFGLNVPRTGLVDASSDESTSTHLAVSKWASELTVGQLGFFSTPYGRSYLSYIQSSGPSIVGLS